MVDLEAPRCIEASDSQSAVSAGLMPRAGELLKGKWGVYRQWLVVCVLVLADVLLALLVWETSAVLQLLWSGKSLELTSLLTSVALWVGLRALLGLYPGYGVDHAEELKRQTYGTLALAATAVISIFTLNFASAEAMSILLIGLAFAGLLLLAPVAHYLVKQRLKEFGIWGKLVIVLGTGATGAKLIRDLKKEWSLGFRPVAVFDNQLTPEGGILESVPYRGAMCGRSDTSYAERVKLDAYYVHNWSVWLDLVILARTVRSIFVSRGAY